MLSFKWYASIIGIKFVEFNTRLNLLHKGPSLDVTSPRIIILSLAGALLFMPAFNFDHWCAFIATCLSTLNMPNTKWMINPFFKQTLPRLQVLQLFSLSTTQSQHVLCLYVFALACLPFGNRYKLWVLLLILLLSNDI